MRQTLRDSHLTENGGPSVYRFLAVARRPPRPELVITLASDPGRPTPCWCGGDSRASTIWLTDPAVAPSGSSGRYSILPTPSSAASTGADGHSRVRLNANQDGRRRRHPG